MIAPAEAITIVDVRTEEDILEVLNDIDQLLAQNTLLLTSLNLCEKLDSSCRCVLLNAIIFWSRYLPSRSAGLMPGLRLAGMPLLTAAIIICPCIHMLYACWTLTKAFTASRIGYYTPFSDLCR